MFEDKHDDFFFSSSTVLESDVIYHGIVGTNGEGLIPETIQEECQIALAKIKHLLERHGLTFNDLRHVVYMIPGSGPFSGCQRLLAEALGSACLTMTLRLRSSFPHTGQRLEFDFTAEMRQPPSQLSGPETTMVGKG